uniref:Uncharacterized protein n=1 Tax=Nelumbo nucifera TaxID=4432 RepID=A0A822YF83_NELNU|nr:TPA_asm: hypothetical protein HUJ06_031144 [Nelumbo nucifera]
MFIHLHKEMLDSPKNIYPKEGRKEKVEGMEEEEYKKRVLAGEEKRDP